MSCLLFTGKSTINGYGRVNRKGKVWLAHRLVMHDLHGGIPPGMNVLHSCDNRLCLNPEHLSFGTQQQNLVEKSLRAPRGRTLKLTAQQVLEARALMHGGSAPREVAAVFSVTYENMLMIRDRKTWKHLPPLDTEKP